MTYAPVVLFVHNRADHFVQTFAALSACPEAKETDLYIFADGAKSPAGQEKVDACRRAVREAAETGAFKSVHIAESPKNRGLAASVIAGVTEVIEACGSAVVLEDDCVCSPYFLRFMNAALRAFAADRRIGAVAGYAPPIEFPETYRADVFTCYRSCSWGWATWRDRWENVDWELKDIDGFYRDKTLVKRFNADGADRFMRLYRQTTGDGSSWSVRFGLHLVKNDMLTVYPRYSLIRNIGCDDSGVHSKAVDEKTAAVDLSKAVADPEVKFVAPDEAIRRRLREFYSGGAFSDLKRFGARTLVLMKEKRK